MPHGLLSAGFWRIKLYSRRFYRDSLDTGRFTSLVLAYRESDLWIGWNKKGAAKELGDQLAAAAYQQLVACHTELQNIIERSPAFLHSETALKDCTPEGCLTHQMIKASRAANVGPMAAVAGAIAEQTGHHLKESFDLDEIIVENGGDIWFSLHEELRVMVYAGLSSLSNRFSLCIKNDLDSCGLACSSGRIGPSHSYGRADAALVLAKNAALADAFATALGNRIHAADDLQAAVRDLCLYTRLDKNAAEKITTLRPQVRGALVILADRMAAAGNIELGPPLA